MDSVFDKRRPRTGWIIALSAIGTFLVVMVALNFTPPEKLLERRVAHRHTVADSQFRREMSVLLGPAIMPRDAVLALQNGDEIFPAMLAAIRGAQTSITFETYIYWSGEVGEAFTAALVERAMAGIPIAIIIDWAGSRQIDPAMLTRLEEAGVQVKRYR